MTIRHQIEEAEARARVTLAEIVCLIHDVPEDQIPAVQEFLTRAVEEARGSIQRESARTLGSRRAAVGALVVAALALQGATCFHGEGDRQIVHQTRGAGAFVESHPGAPPDVRAAGSDVRANMETLAPSVGAPSVPLPYSAKASDDARKKSEEERDQPPAFIGWIAKTVTPFIPWALPVLLGAWGLAEKLLRNGAVKRLQAVYQGVENLKGLAAAGRLTSSDGVVDVLRTTASAYNVYAQIKTELGALKEKGVVSSLPPVASQAGGTA